MSADVHRAREALEAGRTDEALVLLWNAVEPARLARDEDALREIGELARSIPGREAESLAAAVGIEASTAFGDRSQPAERTSERPSAWRVLRVLLPLLVVLLYVVANVAGERWMPDSDGSTTEEPPAKATVGNDVFLVPLGSTSVLELEELVPEFVDVSVRSDDERYGVVSTARVGRGPEATRPERIWAVIAREIRALYLHEEVESAEVGAT